MIDLMELQVFRLGRKIQKDGSSTVRFIEIFLRCVMCINIIQNHL